MKRLIISIFVIWSVLLSGCSINTLSKEESLSEPIDTLVEDELLEGRDYELTAKLYKGGYEKFNEKYSNIFYYIAVKNIGEVNIFLKNCTAKFTEDNVDLFGVEQRCESIRPIIKPGEVGYFFIHLVDLNEIIGELQVKPDIELESTKDRLRKFKTSEISIDPFMNVFTEISGRMEVGEYDNINETLYSAVIFYDKNNEVIDLRRTGHIEIPNKEVAFRDQVSNRGIKSAINLEYDDIASYEVLVYVDYRKTEDKN